MHFCRDETATSAFPSSGVVALHIGCISFSCVLKLCYGKACRWSGKLLVLLHIRAPGLGDFLHRLQRGTGNLMAAAAAMMFVAQVDLDIALLGGTAQIVFTSEDLAV